MELIFSELSRIQWKVYYILIKWINKKYNSYKDQLIFEGE